LKDEDEILEEIREDNKKPAKPVSPSSSAAVKPATPKAGAAEEDRPIKKRNPYADDDEMFFSR